VEVVEMEVGAYEAKTHLSALLDRVSRGERIVITRHGTPVAALTPVSARDLGTTSEVLASLRAFRKGRRLGDLTLQEMIDEGRR
jgi:prevent-host-death family protein